MPPPSSRRPRILVACAVAVLAGGIVLARLWSLEPYLEIEARVTAELPNEIMLEVRATARGGPVTDIRPEVVRGPVRFRVLGALERLGTGQTVKIPTFIALPAPLGAEIRIVQGGPVKRVYRLSLREPKR